MAGLLDVRGSRELKAVVLAYAELEPEVRKAVNAASRSKVRPIWQEAIKGHVETRQDLAILAKGATVAVGARQVRLRAATSRKPLSGGLIPDKDWAADEFGMRRRKKTFKQRSPRGTEYNRTALVGRSLPNRQKHGRVVMPAFGLAGKRIVGVWVITTVHTIRDIVDGRII